MFSKLVEYYLEYVAARRRKPYNKDVVQAQGLRFADEWNARKKEICHFFKMDESEFDYSLHHTLMPKLINKHA